MTSSVRLVIAASCVPLLLAPLSVTFAQDAQDRRRPVQQDDRPYIVAPPPAGAEAAGREPGETERPSLEPERDDPRARLQAQRREDGVQSLALQRNILRERRERADVVRAGRMGADSAGRPLTSLSGPVWVPIGPTGADYEQNGFTYFERDSGRARKILVADADTVYFLSSGGGLWRTSNFTAHPPTWTPLQDALGTTSGGSVAFGRTTSVLYLGTGDPFDFVNVGGSIAVSTDGGNTWAPEIDLGSTLSIRDIAVDTSGLADIVMVATDFGFWRSTDGGATFSLTASGSGEAFAGKAMWSFAQTSAGWLAAAQPCAAANLGEACGQAGVIYLSTDQGASWAPIPNTGNGYTGAGRTTLAVGVPGDSIVYAFAEVTNTSAQKDLFRSIDGGLTWTALGVNSTKTPTNPNVDNPNMNLMHGQAWYNQMILVDPRDVARDTVYLGGDLSTAKSTNASAGAGASWTLLSNWVTRNGMQYVHADCHAAAFSGGVTPTILFGSDGGLFASTDDGAHWSSEKNNGLATFLMYSIAATPAFPSAVLGGAQDNGTRVRKDATTIYNQTIGGDGLGSGWGQNNGYATMGSVQGNATRRNLNGVPNVGATWERATPPLGPSPDGALFFTPVETPTAAVDPTGKVFFTASAGQIYKTINAGVSWTVIGKVGTTIPSGFTFRGQMHGVGVSPVDLLHVGGVGTSGRVVITTDGGATWTLRNINSVISGGFVNTSGLTWADNSTIYVTSITPTMGVARVVKSTDGGATWVRADTGLPDVPTTRVILDPRDSTHNTLLAATHVGIFRSTDGGTSWAQYGLGLPNVVVRDMYMPPNGSFLRIATYGRGFWELPFLTYVSSSLIDDGTSDGDGSLDNGETGHLSVTLHNDGGTDLSSISGTVTSTNPAVSFPGGNAISFPTATAGNDTTATAEVALNGATCQQQLDFAISFDDPALSLPDPVTVNASFLGNLDVLPSGNGNDSLSPTSAWTVTGSSPSLPDVLNWERHDITPSEHDWFEVDSNAPTDQALVSPAMDVGTDPLVISFEQFYVYESGGGLFFDGMVLELSEDGGPWTDVGASASPTYDHVLATGGGNPIEGRAAYSGRSAGFPNFIPVTVNLGTAHAGHSVQFRFRVGTDINGFAAGVHVRNIVVNGITNTPFTTVVAQGGGLTTTALVSSLNPSTYGDSVTFTATVTGGPSTPAGTVTFKDGASVLASGPVDGSGVATFTTSALLAGTHFITASFASADCNHASSASSRLSQIVNARSTSTALGSGLNPSVYGQSVTFTATVTATAGGTPTGMVTFLDGASTLGTTALDGTGHATFSTSALVAGSHSMTASYAGDSNFSASASGVVMQVVNTGTSTTAVVSSLNPALITQSVTFTATVTTQYGGAPTGIVTFRQSASVLASGVPLVGTQATFTTSSLPLGIYPITAQYSGDANNSGSISPSINQKVSKATSTVGLASSHNPSLVGDAVTFTATVGSGLGTPPDGEVVTFRNGGSVIGTGALSGGVATLTTSSLPAGSLSITAGYPGDATRLAGTGTLTQTVGKASSSTALGSSPNPSTYGQRVAFTATVTSSLGAPPDGETITFLDGSATLGTATTASGAATLTVAARVLSAGTHSITAVYAGDSARTGSTSAPVSQVVNPAATNTTLTASPIPGHVAMPVTFTATVVAAAGHVTGSVTFKDGTTTLGTVVVDASGMAALTTSSLTVGTHSISASYVPTANFSASTATVSEVIVSP